MNRPYPPYSPYSPSTPAPRSSTWESQRHHGGQGSRADRYEYDLPYRGPQADGGQQTDVIDDPDADYEEYEDYDEYEDYRFSDTIDGRWVWVAGVAGVVLLVAVICTVVILGGGDSGSVSATVNPPAVTTGQAPATSTAPPAATSSAPAPPPAAPLPAETVTTVAPSPSATAAPPPPAVAAPAPGTVTYRVTGNRQLIDLVTVIYTDAQGALQTDVNVALPWAKTVVLDPGVTLSSVTATSLMGQLNCAITDTSGAAIAAQTNNSMIATCTR